MEVQYEVVRYESSMNCHKLMKGRDCGPLKKVSQLMYIARVNR